MRSELVGHSFLMYTIIDLSDLNSCLLFHKYIDLIVICVKLLLPRGVRHACDNGVLRSIHEFIIYVIIFFFACVISFSLSLRLSVFSYLSFFS